MTPEQRKKMAHDSGTPHQVLHHIGNCPECFAVLRRLMSMIRHGGPDDPNGRPVFLDKRPEPQGGGE